MDVDLEIFLIGLLAFIVVMLWSYIAGYSRGVKDSSRW